MPLFENAKLSKCLAVVKGRDHREQAVETRRYDSIAGSETFELYVKPLANTALINELAAAWCGRQLGLSCPTPYIVDGGDLWAAPEKCTLFGTRACDLPPYYGLELECKYHILKTMGFAQTFVFDVLIANSDRVAANFLCDSTSYFAFDHDKAFLGHNRTTTDLKNAENASPSLFQESELCLDMTGVAVCNIRSVANQWTNQTIDLDRLAALNTFASEQEIEAIATFVRARKSQLVELVETTLKRCT